MKLGDRVSFKKKVYHKPYAPYYDEYKNRVFSATGPNNLLCWRNLPWTKGTYQELMEDFW